MAVIPCPLCGTTLERRFDAKGGAFSLYCPGCAERVTVKSVVTKAVQGDPRQRHTSGGRRRQRPE